MATWTPNSRLEDVRANVISLRALLCGMDTAPMGNESERLGIMKDLESKERELVVLQQEELLSAGGVSRRPPDFPVQSYSLSIQSNSLMPTGAASNGSRSFAQPGHAISSMAPRIVQLDDVLSPMETQASGKRGFDDIDQLSCRPSPKRQATLFDSPYPPGSSPASSRRLSDASDTDDDLWRVLGLDSKDSFREFRDEQKKAEQWLIARREEERRDAECARRLQDDLFASARPNSAQSLPARYSDSSVLSRIPTPTRDLESAVSNSLLSPLPTNYLESRTNGSSRSHVLPGGTSRHSHNSWIPTSHISPGSGGGDISEIASTDTRHWHGYFSDHLPSDSHSVDYIPKNSLGSGSSSSFVNRTASQNSGRFPSSQSSWGPTGQAEFPLLARSIFDSSRSTRPGPGRLYELNNLRGLTSRLDVYQRDPSNNDLWAGIPLFPEFDSEFEQSNGYLNGETIDYDPKKTSEEIKRLLETIRPDSDISVEDREGTPSALRYPLMEHQKLGLSWMKTMEESEKKGGILADDMGLGKTVQAISLMVSRPPTDLECKPTLIVTPVSLMQQWRREIQRMLRPGRYQMSIYTLHGEKHKRNITFTDLKQYDVVLTTYGTLAAEFRRKELYNEREKRHGTVVDFTTRKSNLPVLGPISKWYRVILDEAQCIKNRNTKSAQAACDIDAIHRWCMSGTPIMNNVGEFHSLLKFLRIRPYCALERFTLEFSRPLKNPGTYEHGKAMEKFRVLLKAVLLRRTKTSTIDGQPILQLPPKITEKVHAVFNEDEQQFYNALEARTQIQFNRYLNAGSVGRNYSSILVLLLRLRQACCHPHLIKDYSFDVNANTKDLDMLANAKLFDPQVVARLKENSDMECPICIDAVENPIIFFPCGHSTCAECFSRISDPALLVREGIDGDLTVKCPNCRGLVDPKKITDHTTFTKVHYPDVLDKQAGEVEATDTTKSEADDSDDESDGVSLSNFIADDDDESSSSAKTKGSGKMPRGSKKTLAALKKEVSKNQKSKRKYFRRLEKTFVSSAKIDKTIEILQRIQDEGNGEKTIVFSQFTSLLDLLEIPMNRKDWIYRRYDGSMRPTDRNNAVADFSDDPNCKIMLVSLKAGNAGLNLVSASQVIVFDPFWNPYVEDQAVDRAYRIGQLREVHVHRILVEKTVEDRILELQEKKRSLVEGALDENAGRNISRLGIRELSYLFGINS